MNFLFFRESRPSPTIKVEPYASRQVDIFISSNELQRANGGINPFKIYFWSILRLVLIIKSTNLRCYWLTKQLISQDAFTTSYLSWLMGRKQSKRAFLRNLEQWELQCGWMYLMYLLLTWKIYCRYRKCFYLLCKSLPDNILNSNVDSLSHNTESVRTRVLSQRASILWKNYLTICKSTEIGENINLHCVNSYKHIILSGLVSRV